METKMTSFQQKSTKLLRSLGYQWNVVRSVGSEIYLYQQVTLETTRRRLQFLVAEIDYYGNIKMGNVA